MQNTKPTAVAGLFYQSLPSVLAEMMDNDLAQALPPSEMHIPKVIIVPHTGYIYSGPVAASAYRYLLPIRHIITQVVIIGPSHRVAFHVVALSSANYFETPLGSVPIDKAA